MKKISIIILFLLIAGGYTLLQKSGVSHLSTSNNPENNSSDTNLSSNKVYKNGTYDGDTIDAFYGMVQVETIIISGKISDIKVLQFPDSPGHTTEVSNQAPPLLKQEAIQNQSSPVNVISGATQTSDGFNKSLASALSKAQ